MVLGAASVLAVEKVGRDVFVDDVECRHRVSGAFCSAYYM